MRYDLLLTARLTVEDECLSVWLWWRLLFHLEKLLIAAKFLYKPNDGSEMTNLKKKFLYLKWNCYFCDKQLSFSAQDISFLYIGNLLYVFLNDKLYFKMN